MDRIFYSALIGYREKQEEDGLEDLLQVGVITITHGVRGEVKVFPTTDDANRFKKLKEVILDTGKEQLPLEIAQVKFFKNLVILKFKGIDNINDIEKYKGKSLYVTREHAVKLKKDEYFIADLIGMRAVTEEGEDELLVPAIKDCVKNVDIEGGVMTLHLLEGLRDINKK